MLIEEHEMNIQFEQTAWENAWMLNRTHPLVPEEDFDYIKQHSLATYQKLYEQDLQAYHHLLNQRDGAISLARNNHFIPSQE